MYFLKVIVSGRVHEVIKSYTKTEKGPDTRGPRVEKTPEQMAESNYRHAVKRLARILNCNFVDGDLWVTLTYKKSQRPDTKTAQKELNNFIKRVKRRFEKEDKIFKWVTVTEYKSKAIHHHMVVSNPDGLNVAKILTEQWKQNGIVHMEPLYSDGNYTQLAEYMVKETDKTFRESTSTHKQRWSSSRNMAKPKVICRKIRAKRWNPQPKAKKGYYIEPLSIVNGVNKYNGREYQMYTMVQIE